MTVVNTFAHIADVHLGENHNPAIKKLEIETFSKTLDICIERKVDFILICGDLFHVPIPDLEVVKEAVTKMRKVKELGIPIYAIYGSHDYTPTGTSIIDLIESSGVLVKIARGKVDDDKLKLDFVQDEKTRAKLVGINARKMGLESKYYEILDRESLEQEEGFKVFAFHSGLDEFKPHHLRLMETIAISLFPKDFDYYAGGHIHKRSENSLPGYEKVVFPGALTGYGRDLEDTSKGEKRGFYIVNFTDKLENVEFVENKPVESIYYEYDPTGKSSVQVQTELKENLAQLDVAGKIIVLKVSGELSGGKISDIGFPSLVEELRQRGAIDIHLNKHGLKSKEYTAIATAGEESTAIESRIFKENIGEVKVSVEALQNESGLRISNELLEILRVGKQENETKESYERRLREHALEVLGAKKVIDG